VEGKQTLFTRPLLSPLRYRMFSSRGAAGALQAQKHKMSLPPKYILRTMYFAPMPDRPIGACVMTPHPHSLAPLQPQKVPQTLGKESLQGIVYVHDS
jgi:hypothetical protein